MRFIIIVPLLLMLNGFALKASTYEKVNAPSLISVLRETKDLNFCKERLPLERSEIKERFEKELMLILGDRPQVYLWLKRSSRFFPYIEKELRKNNMPSDLKYLAVTESALRPHAGSHKGALGVWQLMASTGKKYGLSVNSRIDERRNFKASTRAALKYLKVLKKQFGSWSLAAAAYNMGEEGLHAEILEQDTKDYYQLYLPLETQRFLFRIAVIKTIMSKPGAFGFQLTASDYYPESAVDVISLECYKDVPIKIIAKAGLTTYKKIKDLNPELRGYFIKSGKYQLNLPLGSKKGFRKRYRSLYKVYNRKVKNHTYVIRKGDNLSKIAEKFGVPLKSILIWNQLNPRHTIKPGRRLIIFSGEIKKD